MSRTHVLGLDLGTSGVKAMLLRIDDGSQTSFTVDLSLSTPRPGWSEQNPADWWEAAVIAVRGVLARSEVEAADVAALAISGQMHGATLLDRQGDIVRPCILWNDARTGAECDRITELIGREQLLRTVGNPALAGFTAPKLLWVRSHEPESYRRIATVLLPKDYLNYKLTGNLATEVSDASGTLLFDIARRCWSGDVVRELEIDPEILPPVHESSDIVGIVTAGAASATGLREGTPVVAGGADNACAAAGMGVVLPEQVLVSLGTSGTIVAPAAAPLIDPLGRLHAFCHVAPETWYVMGVVLSEGASIRWFLDTVGAEYKNAADPHAMMFDEAATIPRGSDGLLFLPYLAGERTPHGDPNARGVLFGLSLFHSRAHVARCVVEGVTFALADSAGLMRELGIEIASVRLTGGGARSDLRRHILADTLNARVVTAATDAGAALGAAILAGVGVGIYSSISDATAHLVTIASETAPDPAGSAAYAGYHARYDRLYPALKSEFAGAAVEP